MNDFTSKKTGKVTPTAHSVTPEEITGVFDDIKGDGLFAIKVSEDMALRNILRSGLVEALGKDTDKIPMFVSWPGWLDDGIVCLFAKDLHAVIHKVVMDTVLSLNYILKVEGLVEEGERDKPSMVTDDDIMEKTEHESGNRPQKEKTASSGIEKPENTGQSKPAGTQAKQRKPARG